MTRRPQAPTGRKRTVSGALSLPLNGVLFTIPSRYWFPIGRRWYLALEGGPPSFPPDTTCPVVLTMAQHAPGPSVAYGALTRSGGPFQQPSAAWPRLREQAAARSLRPVQPPRRSAGRLPTRPGFGLLPVRSPLLRESFLFLGVLRCFSSPGAPRTLQCGADGRPPAGCPIRSPLAHRLPAPPQSISPRGSVLPRPPAPRHPPCARDCGLSIRATNCLRSR
jgi:hypothetical protein